LLRYLRFETASVSRVTWRRNIRTAAAISVTYLRQHIGHWLAALFMAQSRNAPAASRNSSNAASGARAWRFPLQQRRQLPALHASLLSSLQRALVLTARAKICLTPQSDNEARYRTTLGGNIIDET